MTAINISKFCPKCKITKPSGLFGKKSSTKDGLYYYCKSCLSEYQKVKRAKPEVKAKKLAYDRSRVLQLKTTNSYIQKTEKVCRTCSTVKDINDFAVDSARLDGRNNECRLCDNRRQSEQKRKRYNENADLRGKIRLQVKEYRKTLKVLGNYEIPNEKKCSSCFSVKPIGDFSIKNGAKTKHSSRCKSCERLDGKEKYKKQINAGLNPNRAWKEKNWEKVRELKRESKRKWRIKFPEKAKELGRLDARRRSLGRNKESVAYAEILLKDPCCYCGGKATSIDHIHPVKKGGSNNWSNLTPACVSCNSKKNTKGLLRFFLYELQREKFLN